MVVETHPLATNLRGLVKPCQTHDGSRGGYAYPQKTKVPIPSTSTGGVLGRSVERSILLERYNVLQLVDSDSASSLDGMPR